MKAHNQVTPPKGGWGGQQANLPPQVIRPQMRAQHNLEDHDSFDGDNYDYGIDDQAQQERLGGRGRRIEVGIRLMVENTIKGMMMKIKDSTTSRLHFHFSKEVVTQMNTLIG